MQKMNCKRCAGTGLEPPLHDKDCVNPKCKEGQVPMPGHKPSPAAKAFPDTDDGNLARDLCDIEDMTDWEINFTNSIAEQVDRDEPLTPKQRKKIMEVLEKRW